VVAFLRRETSAAGSSHSSPPWPMTSGTARTKLTLRPFLRVPVRSPPGPGLFPPAAALLRMSWAAGHRWARAMSMRGRLAAAAAEAEAEAEAAAARSVDGLRKALTSSSSCALEGLGSAGLAGASSLEKILVRQRLDLDISLLAASWAASRASTMAGGAVVGRGGWSSGYVCLGWTMLACLARGRSW
jgi:hypothetical protein